MTKLKLFAAAAALAALAAPANAAFYVEVGDAGGLPATAQVTSGAPPFQGIQGTLTGANDADMYLITITSPGTFSATTVGGATFDTQLYLFNLAGQGIRVNDDSVGLQSTITAGATTFGTNVPVPAGQYYIVITAFDNDPISGTSALIFPNNFAGLGGPTSPTAVIAGYDNFGGGAGGAYTIFIAGADFGVVTPPPAAVPEPASVALLAAGVVGFAGRRLVRRKAA